MNGFTQERKQHIKKLLIEYGFELFSRYGLQKTTVQELADSAGISKGSFYSFFESKEELYLEIIQQERRKLIEPLLKELQQIDDPEKEIKYFLHYNLELIRTKPILKEIMLAEVIDSLTRKISDDRLKQIYIQESEFMRPFVRRWQGAGVLMDEPETVARMFRAVVLGLLKSKEIKEGKCSQVEKRLFEIIAAGIVCRGHCR